MTAKEKSLPYLRNRICGGSDVRHQGEIRLGKSTEK